MAASKRKVPTTEAEERNLSPPPTKRKIQSTTSQNKVASFFTPTSRKPPEKIKWRTVNKTLLTAKYEPSTPQTQPPQQRRRIAAFDLDGTLITPASGKTFSKDASDWKWWHPGVPGELKQMHDDGHQIIIFSNQGGISMKGDSKTAKSDGKRLTDFKSKVGAVLNRLELPISIYAATERDMYRKPRDGMWKEMLEDYDLEFGDGIDVGSSVFVGDAAGRLGDDDGMGKKDFAASDRDFAANVGIRFATPEEFFLREERRTFTRSFDPNTYVEAGEMPDKYGKTNEKDIVLLCGSPGVGKSSFYWKYLEPLGYERVNQDILKSREKCLKKATHYLSDGHSVVVDNTNADPDTRLHWIALSKSQAVPIRCVHLQGDAKLCEHNDTVRALNGPLMNPEQRAILPKIAFSSFASRFRVPEVAEGFQDVLSIPFRFNGTEEQRTVWTRFWV